MSTIVAHNCSSLDNITTVETEGTVTAGNQGGFGFDTITMVRNATGSLWDVLAITTDVQTLSAGGGEVGYMQVRFATAEQRDWFFGGFKNPAVPAASRGKVYSSFTTGWSIYECNGLVVGSTVAIGDPQVWVDIKMEIPASDGLGIYSFSLSDTGALGYDNFNQAYVDARTWTTPFTITNCGDQRSGPFYFTASAARPLTTLDISLMILTDDGTLTVGGPYGTGASDLLNRDRRKAV